MPEKLPCVDCSLQSIEDLAQRETCRAFVQDVIHQWWSGNPTVELDYVAMDNYITSHRAGRTVAEDDRVIMDDCFAEHSSDRCQNLNP